MAKIDIDQAQTRFGSAYPPPFDEPCRERKRWKLGDVAGLTQFGVNLMHLPPGAWTSQRHWHSHEDEFIWVVAGEVVLVTDAGEEVLGPGDCAGFKAGLADGHHVQNRSDHEAVLLEVGSRHEDADGCVYPDIDLQVDAAGVYRRSDGTPYAHDAARRR